MKIRRSPHHHAAASRQRSASVDCGIQAEGTDVYLSFRTDNGASATLKLSRSAGAALAASLVLATDSDAGAHDTCQSLRGSLEVRSPREP